MITNQRPAGSRHRYRRPTRGRLAIAVVAAAVLVIGLVYAIGGSGSTVPRRPHAAQRPPPVGHPHTAPRPRAPAPAPAPVWKPVWTANFTGPDGGRLSGRVWKFDTGTGVFGGTQEIETMTHSTANVHVDGQDGLDITVLGHGSPGDGGWTSGRIQTRRLFAPPPGRETLITASIRQPDPAVGTGYWPAFWMLGSGMWPESGEIDILESVDALGTHSGTLHCGNTTQRNSDGTFGPCHEGYGLGSGMLPCPGCLLGFHTYSVIIDRRNEADQRLSWYFDGREFFSVSESTVGQAAWSAAIDHGFTLILSVAVGGTYPDIVCRCVSPTAQTSGGGTMTVRQLGVYVS